MTIHHRSAYDPETPPEGVVVLIPVYNDWEALELLLYKLDHALAEQGLEVSVLVVDDASEAVRPADMLEEGFQAIQAVEVLALRRNVGHQRAIAIGLTHLDENSSYQAVLVMDGDGEDAPSDVPRLIEEYRRTRGTQVVFAERRRRSESWPFKLGYRAYKAVHFLLTGKKVRVGNFSIVPRLLLHRLTAVSELWNHYAAAVFKARIPNTSIPTRRAKRLVGQSKMSFVSLVVHGLSALSVYSDIIGVRLLIATGGLFALACLLLMVIVTIRLTTDLAIPGWTSTLSVQILLMFLQLVTVSLPFVFLILQGRSGAGFLPVRDYAYFVDRLIPIPLVRTPRVPELVHNPVETSS